FLGTRRGRGIFRRSLSRLGERMGPRPAGVDPHLRPSESGRPEGTAPLPFSRVRRWPKSPRLLPGAPRGWLDALSNDGTPRSVKTLKALDRASGQRYTMWIGQRQGTICQSFPEKGRQAASARPSGGFEAPEARSEKHSMDVGWLSLEEMRSDGQGTAHSPEI